MTDFLKKHKASGRAGRLIKSYEKIIQCSRERWIRFTTSITAAYSTPAMAQMNQLYRAWPLPEGPKVYHMKIAVTSSQ